MKLRHSALLITAVLALCACSGQDKLDRILDREELTIVTRNGPATYYEEKGSPAGFEYSLSQMFADELGVALRVEVRHSIGGILEAVRRGRCDFAAAGLSITESRENEFNFSTPYYAVNAQVIYLGGSSRPRKVEDLMDKRVVVMADSSHAELLSKLRQDHPELTWEEIDEAEPPDLLDMVTSGAATFAIIDSQEFTANHLFFPRLRVGFTFPTEAKLAWLFSPGKDSLRLRKEADNFLQRIRQDGSLEQLKEQHFGHAWGVTPVDSQTFSRRVRKRLPRYEEMIRTVADEYLLDWHLLAAIAYQESHWNPYARSPTGVRGMMMLTSNTAQEMKVENRLDPLQSLRGGARYLKKIKRLLPADIAEPDRTWFTLAAYNIGRGHLEDARVITERQGGDPHLWVDVKERLPLLQKSKYYRGTRYGYARGSEPVTYVKNIRHYYSILAWQDINRNQPAAPVNPDDHVPSILRSSRLTAL